MKNEKGITLISLVVYIILMTFVVAGVTAITTNLYSNVSEIDKDAKGTVAWSKVNMIILNDIKNEGVTVGECSKSKLVLKNVPNKDGITKDVTYLLYNEGLYRDNVKICGNVKSGWFQSSPGSTNMELTLQINSYIKNTLYCLEG